MKENHKLENENILKLLIKFSVPAIIGMVVQAIYNLVDRAFIGNAPELGTLGLAAAALAFPIMMITMALALWVSNGGGILFSIALGAKKTDEAKIHQSNAFILALIIGFLIMIIGNVFINPILDILGASKKVHPFAKDYLSIILYGSVFSSISMFGNNFSRAQGNPNNAMISMLIGAGFNIIFDYILIMKMGMGMKGAAIATIGGQFLSAVYQLSFLFGRRSLIPLKIKELRLSLKNIIKPFETGMPVFLVQVSSSILMFVLNKTAFSYGSDMGISVIAILSSIQMMVQMPIVGFIQGQVPIISYNYGAKRFDRVQETLKYSIISSTIVMVVFWIFIQFNTESIVRIFNSDPVLLEKAIPSIKIAFIMIPIIGLQAMCASMFQAMSQIKQASILNLSRQVIILIPFILILSSIIGFKGIFIALPLADVLSTTITVYFALRHLRKIRVQ